MDSIASDPTCIRIYEPTDLILGALKLKNAPYRLQRKRHSLTDIPGPALELRDEHSVVGEAAVLGWLDRRYPCPELFPAPLDTYAKAATLAHGLLNNTPLAHTIYESQRVRKTPYLFGHQPNIADLALWLAMKKANHPKTHVWADHLFAGELF